MVAGFLALFLVGSSLAWSKDKASTAASPKLPFSQDLDAALNVAKSSGKPLYVAFAAVWCPHCRRMKRETLRDPRVVAMAEDFIWVMVDIDRNLSLAQDYGVVGVPHIFLLDPEGIVRVRLQGVVEPQDLQDHLSRFLDELSEPAATVPAEPVHTTHGPQSSLIYTPKGYRGLSICFSHVGYGPLRLNSLSPFQALRLGIRPRTPSTLSKGQYQARGTSTWVNVWAVERDVFAPLPGEPDNEYYLDYEMLQATASVAYGITDTLEIEGEFQTLSRFGGKMDGFIQGFHDLTGIDQNQRDEVAKGLFTFELDPMDGRTPVSLDSGDRGIFTTSVQVSLQHNVTCGTARLPAFSYSVTARWNDSDDLSGGTSLDAGISVALARRFGPIYLYGTLGYSFFGQDDFRGLELQDTQATFLAAFEWRFRPKQSFLVQYLITEGLVEDFAPFSEMSNEITLGWKMEVIKNGVLEFGLIENLIEFDNSPDFGFHLGYSQRF